MFRFISINFFMLSPNFQSKAAIKKNLKPLEANEPIIKILIGNPKKPDAIVNNLKGIIGRNPEARIIIKPKLLK